jgi:hypothetical protein
MPKIHLILEDGAGDTTEQAFALEGDLEHLDGIDEAVEQFKNDALPQIERALLHVAQERTLAKEKKQSRVGVAPGCWTQCQRLSVAPRLITRSATRSNFSGEAD